MRAFARLATLAALVTFLALPEPASAGGWWSYIALSSRYMAPGMVVHAVDTQTAFRSTQEAERARRSGHYYVYLIKGLDPDVVKDQMLKADPREGWWQLGDAMAIRVGRVSLRGWDANVATAHARFVTPDLAPGRYAVMFCDAGCKRPLADLIPSNVRVVADPLTARIAGRLDRVRNRAAVQHQRLLRRERQQDARTAEALGRMQARIGVLDRRLDRMVRASSGRTRDAGSPWWGPVGWYLAGAMTAGVAALLVARRRRSPGTPTPPEGWNGRRPVEMSERLGG